VRAQKKLLCYEEKSRKVCEILMCPQLLDGSESSLRLSMIASRLKKVPLVLAPMAGVSTPKLVAAGCNAGILAFHGGGFRGADLLRSDVEEITELCPDAGMNIGVNLFVCEKPVRTRVLEAKAVEVEKKLRDLCVELGLPESLIGNSFREAGLPDLEAQLKVVIEKRIRNFSFCFGRLDRDWIHELQKNGTTVFGTATTVDEARLLESDGVDAIFAQSAEAGGHRGSFHPGATLVGGMSLIPQIVDAVQVPVIAAGGIADGRGLAAALCLGAHGAAIGTAFLTSSDSDAPEVHKRNVMETNETGTIVTDIFTGRSARGIVNKFTKSYLSPQLLHSKHFVCADNPDTMPYPIQQDLTNPVKKEGLQQDSGSFGSLWCGQSSQLATSDDVQTIVNRILEEAWQLGPSRINRAKQE